MKKLLLITLLAFLAIGRAQDRAEIQLQAAIKKEVFDGDLKAAIEQYKKIIANSSASRAVKAKALLQLGGCYEKQGNSEAGKTFERVVKEFADQSDIAAQASSRLKIFTSGAESSKPANGLSMHKLDVNVLSVGFPLGVSPDGQHLVTFGDFNSNSLDFTIYDLAANARRALTHLSEGELAVNPLWSPDGTRIVYEWSGNARFELRTIDSDGANPKTIYASKVRAGLSGWFPDNKTILAKINGENVGAGLFARISVQDGTMVPIPLKADWGDSRVSPDGRYILNFSRGTDLSGVYSIAPVTGGESREVLRENHNMRPIGWDTNGRSILFTSDRNGSIDMWRIAIVNGTPGGAAEIVKENIGDLMPLGFTQNGSLFYFVAAGSQHINVASIDWRDGSLTSSPVRVNTRSVGDVVSPAWSPDGRQLAYLAATTAARSTNYGTLCIWSPAVETLRGFSLKYPLKNGYPGIWWSSDGQYLFGNATLENGEQALERIHATTGETSVQAKISKGQGSLIGSARNGNTTFILRTETGTQIQYLVALDCGSGLETELYRSNHPRTDEAGLLWINGPVSPDGKWVALRDQILLEETPKKYRSKLLLVPTAGGAAREVVSIDGFRIGVPYFWGPDGTHIYYCTRMTASNGDSSIDGKMWEIGVDGGTPRKLEKWTRTNLMSLTANVDGNRIAYISSNFVMPSLWVLKNLPPSSPQANEGCEGRDTPILRFWSVEEFGTRGAKSGCPPRSGAMRLGDIPIFLEDRSSATAVEENRNVPSFTM